MVAAQLVVCIDLTLVVPTGSNGDPDVEISMAPGGIRASHVCPAHPAVIATRAKASLKAGG